ncbi:MAG: hypothetical protein IKV36_00060 [Clostridia bacterium]|nr:hypothetical protein [Clostridia bacterium]
MKKNIGNVGLPKPTKTNNTLQSAIRTPKVVETINRQQRILSSGTAMTAVLKNSLSTLPSQTQIMSNCISGLTTFKYAIDTIGFDPQVHIPTWQQNISSALSSLASSMPKSANAINLSRLNGFECETALALKNAGISAQMIMPSLQIAETLQSFGKMSADILPKVDMTLASSQLLVNYSSLVEKQYSHIQRNVVNSEKHLKVIELATRVVQDQIVSARDYIADETIDTDVSSSEENQSKTIIQYMPIYLGYALRNNSSYDLEEEYAKSAMGQIAEGGKNIASKLQYINDIRMAAGEEPIFKPTNKAYTAIPCLTSSFSVDQNTFGNVIDSLYMLIYEGSGSAKRIREILSDAECSPLWDVKHLRTDCRHDVEHGSDSEIKKKQRNIGKAYHTICGKSKPFKQKEWVTAHCNLFVNVNAFLDLIIEKLTVTTEE